MEKQINVNFRRTEGNTLSPVRHMPEQHFRGAPETPSVHAEKKDRKIISKMLDRIVSISIFAIFFGFPLFSTGLAAQGLIFEKQIYFYFWLLLGLVAWAAKGVIFGEMSVKRTPLDWPILGFWVAYLISTILSVDRWHSFWGAFSDPSRGLMSITAYIIAYYLIVSNFNLQRLKLIMTAIVSSGTLVVIWTFLAIMGVKFLPMAILQYAPLSLLGSMSDLGILFTVLVPILSLAILKVVEQEGLSKLRKNISAAFLLLIMAMDLILISALYNYISWLGFFAGVVILMIFILAKIVRLKESWAWFPIVVFILVMVIRMTGTVSLAKINIPVEVSLNYQTSADIAKEGLKNKLILGSGPSTYGYDFSLYRPKDFNLNALYNLRFFQGTGALAEAVPTIGLVGTVIFVILILAFFGSQFYLLAKDKEKNKLYSLGIFSGTIMLVIYVLSTRFDGTILGIFAFFLALTVAVSLYESEPNTNSLNLSLKASPKFALALAFVFMVVSAGVAFLFVFLGKVYVADLYSGRANANFAKDSNNALLDVGKAINLNSSEAQYYSQLSRFYMSLANQEAAKGKDNWDVNKIQQYLNFSIQAATVAKNMNKNDVGTVENLALIYENTSLYLPDSLTLAQQTYQEALALEPHNPVYYLKEGQLDVSLAGTKTDADSKKQLVAQARDMFQKSVDEKNNYTDGYYQLALADEALNNLDRAIDEGGKAVQLNQNNANYLLLMGRLYQERNKNDDMKQAEQFYKAVVALNDKDVNGHFYLGMYYEKNNRRTEAKNEYNKVISLLQDSQANNQDTINQLKKMISNVDAGIANTPQSLGLVTDNSQPANTESSAQPASTQNPTLNQTQNSGQ